MARYFGKWSHLSRPQKIASVAKKALHDIKAMGGEAGKRADEALQQIAKIKWASKQED